MIGPLFRDDELSLASGDGGEWLMYVCMLSKYARARFHVYSGSPCKIIM